MKKMTLMLLSVGVFVSGIAISAGFANASGGSLCVQRCNDAYNYCRANGGSYATCTAKRKTCLIPC